MLIKRVFSKKLAAIMLVSLSFLCTQAKSITKAKSIAKEGCLTRYDRDKAVNLYYKLQGKGYETVVLIHDFATNSNVWECTVKYLAKKFKVLTLDLRGHGRSSKPASGYSYDVFADDINYLLYKLHIEKAHLVGWGFGGAIAQAYATRYPDQMGKLILLASTPLLIATEGYSYGLPAQQASYLIELLKGNPQQFCLDWTSLIFTEKCDLTYLRNKFVKLLKTNDFNVLYTIALEVLGDGSLIPNLGKINAATCIITGGLDALTPAGASYFMDADINNSQAYALPCSGHAAHLTSVSATNELLIKLLYNKDEKSNPRCECDICPHLGTELLPNCSTRKYH